MSTSFDPERPLVAQALALLGKRHFVLAIQDPAFPSPEPDGGGDCGRGSPYSAGAARFFEAAAAMGFTGIQFGPQGLVSEGSDSPYEGTLFSRNFLNLDLDALVAQELLPRSVRDEVVAARPVNGHRRVAHRAVWAAMSRVVSALHEKRRDWPAPMQARFELFRRLNEPWLRIDALYDALCIEHGHPNHLLWPGEAGERDRELWGREQVERRPQRVAELEQRHAGSIERHAVAQFLLGEQHQAMRQRLRALGLSTFGDLQIGMSARDAWAHGSLLLEGYRMGAPPSLTNPDGQPWGYGVLDPETFGTPDAPGPAIDFMQARLAKLMSEMDGLRIDHPQGWVCPWVYRADDPDPIHAVQCGARLRDSPAVPDHPRLDRFAIPTAEQIDWTVPRHADGWVRALSEPQVSRYGVLISAMLDAVCARGLSAREVACEVLSTLPYPLARVMQRHGLGRFRVLSKADPGRTDDVYRSENAQEADWVMLGNHDTPPIWLTLERWTAQRRRQQAEYLAHKLVPDRAARADHASRWTADPAQLAQAMLADALHCPAGHVYLFFADLLGMRETYNAPGTVGPHNWSLRVPPDWESRYLSQRSRGGALHLPRALALALRARGLGDHPLVGQLEAVTPLGR
jgi:4-alpha-glucanotransferase